MEKYKNDNKAEFSNFDELKIFEIFHDLEYIWTREWLTSPSRLKFRPLKDNSWNPPDKASFYRHHIEILAEKNLPDG